MSSLVQNPKAQQLAGEIKNDYAEAITGDLTENLSDRFVNHIVSNNTVVNQRFLASRGELEDWVGELAVEQLEQKAFTLTSSPLAKSYGIREEDLFSTDVDNFRSQISNALIGIRNRYRDNAFVSALEGAASGSCPFDEAMGGSNVAFFSTSHVFDKVNGVQSNIMTSTNIVTDPTGSLQAISNRFSGFKDINGKVMGMRLSHLIVPSSLQTAAAVATDPVLAFEGVAKSNPFGRPRVDYTVMPKLVDQTTYYAVAENPILKPFDHYHWRSSEPYVEVLEGGDHQFKTREILFAVKHMAKVVPGAWFTMIKVSL